MNLVYGKFDYGTAKNLANMLENLTQRQGGVPGTSTSNPIGQLIRVKNWAMENLTLVYDPYLTIVASNKPYAGSWLWTPNRKSGPESSWHTERIQGTAIVHRDPDDSTHGRRTRSDDGQLLDQ